MYDKTINYKFHENGTYNSIFNYKLQGNGTYDRIINYKFHGNGAYARRLRICFWFDYQAPFWRQISFKVVKSQLPNQEFKKGDSSFCQKSC